MAEPADDPPFFIGWSRTVSGRTAGFMLNAALLVIAGFALAGFAIATATPDSGGGDYIDNYGGEVERAGVVELRGYPVLRIAPAAGAPAHALLLASEGTNGAEDQAKALYGQAVHTKGLRIKRGAIEMLELADGADGIHAEPAAAFTPAKPVPLGRWRLTGEICDGKCYTGAMRYGMGLAHKACANICMRGGVAPVFVSTAPVDGASFLLMVDPAGNPLPSGLYNLAALRVVVEGEVERIDDLLIFKADLRSAKVL